MSAYSDLEDSLGATHAWPLDDASAPYLDRIGSVDLAVTSGSATAQNATLILGTPTVSLNGTLSVATGALAGVTSFTLVVWVKIAGNQANGLPLYVGNNGSDGFGTFLSAHHSGSAGAEFQGLFGGVGFLDSTPDTLSFGSVYMLAIRRTGGTTDLSLNGVTVGSGTGATPFTPSGITSISLVADVAFASAYPTGLSDSDLLDLYNTATQLIVDPQPITWTGSTFYLPPVMEPLQINWSGRLFSLPDLPTPFPTTGRHAFGGSSVTRVEWSGDVVVGRNNLNSFQVPAGATTALTATVFLNKDTPGIPETVGTLESVAVVFRAGETQYAVTADTFNATTGVCTFTLSGLADAGVYQCRLYLIYDSDDILQVPTYPCIVTNQET